MQTAVTLPEVPTEPERIPLKNGNFLQIYPDGSVKLVYPLRGCTIEVSRFGDPTMEITHLKQKHSARGSVLMELAFALPVFLFVVLAGFDLLNAMRAKANLDWTAAQAASCVAKQGCDFVATIAKDAAGLSLDVNHLSAATNTATNTVTLTYAYQPVGPFFPSLILTSQAESQ